MCQIATKPSELAACMIERVSAVLMMETAQLDLDWLTVFPIPQITACCARMSTHLVEPRTYLKTIQHELIRNAAFAPFLVWFMEKAAQIEAEEPLYDAVCALMENRLSELLETCQSNERTITDYPGHDVFTALTQGQLESAGRLVYLENFASMNLPDTSATQVAVNLSVCVDVPLVLNEVQKALMMEPFVAGRRLFSAARFGEISELFGICPGLADIARMLHQNGVVEELTLRDYRYFAEDAAEYHRLLDVVVQRLGPKASGELIHHWQKNYCSLSELRRMERRTRITGDLDWDGELSTYSGYVNLLYGKRFKAIDLSRLTDYQEDVLTYAIIHNKKHFIRLVDENSKLFFDLSRKSILFLEEFYRERFNLNELTAKDLADCAGMSGRKLSGCLFTGSRPYTFPEWKLLYSAPTAYMVLYGKLQSESRDYRIRVLRQLLKRDALNEINDTDELAALAAPLDRKPLHDWRQEELGHIEGLTAGDTAKLLVHSEKLAHLLPGIQTRTDAMLVLRNLDRLAQFDSIDGLKADLFDSDPGWLALADGMELGAEFKAQHRDSIIEFLCRDGAGSREQKPDSEWVTLFLERPYISRANPEDEHRIKRMFAELAKQKAKELGAMLVLSMEYSSTALPGFAQTQLSIYISASKAGAQYLDSLGGQATTSKQGSYESSHFLMDRETAETILKEV